MILGTLPQILKEVKRSYQKTAGQQYCLRFNIEDNLDLKWLNVSTMKHKHKRVYDSIYIKNSDRVNPQIQKADCSFQKLGRGRNGK